MGGANQRKVKGGVDLHETPPQAVRALLKVEQLPAIVWDPCCGPGAIVRELQESGRGVWASDLINYAWGQDHIGSFFDWTTPPPKVQAIVMNPPYRQATEFIEHGLDLVPEIYALVRLNWIAAVRERHPHVYDRLARVHVFSRRLPMMHRANWAGPKASSQFDHAWCCWEARPSPAMMLRRIDWKAA